MGKILIFDNAFFDRTLGYPCNYYVSRDIAQVLSEDAETADLTPNERGLIIGACAAVANLSEQMHAEMDFQQLIIAKIILVNFNAMSKRRMAGERLKKVPPKA